MIYRYQYQVQFKKGNAFVTVTWWYLVPGRVPGTRYFLFHRRRHDLMLGAGPCDTVMDPRIHEDDIEQQASSGNRAGTKTLAIFILYYIVCLSHMSAARDI